MNDDLPAAVKTLTTAMALPGVKKRSKPTASTSSSSSSSTGAKKPVTLNDRVDVFLELADAHLAANSQHEGRERETLEHLKVLKEKARRLQAEKAKKGAGEQAPAASQRALALLGGEGHASRHRR